MKASLRLFCAVGLWMALLISSPAATLTWVGGTGDWSVPSNWDGGAVPGAADIAVINSGDVTADWESTVLGLTITGGTLRGVGIIHITGIYNLTGGLDWRGGTMTGSGQVIVDAQGTGGISAAADKSLERRLENNGAITWDDGRIIFRSGTLANIGVMTIVHDADLVDGGGSGVLENTGTLHKVSVGTVHFNGVAFNQGGTLDFAAGTLWLNGGGQNTKTIAVPAGAKLRIDRDYVQAVGSTLTGPGDVSFEAGVQSVQGAYTVSGVTTISGATVVFATDVTIPQLQLSSGTLQGVGVAHLSGSFSWSGGTMSGAGRTIIENGATAVWTGDADKNLERALDNSGTTTWDEGRMIFRSGTLNNIGVMTIAHDADLVDGGGSGVLENTGTLHKTSLGAVHFNGVAFNQGGTLDFAAGTLWLTGGGQNTKTIVVPAGGKLRIDRDYVQAAGSALTGPGDVSFESGIQSVQGVYAVSGITTISGGTVGFETDVTVQQLQLSGGRLQGAGIVHLSKSFNWTGGTMGGAGRTVIDNGATGIWTGSDKLLQRTVDNGGAITWDQGLIFFQSGTLNNLGVMTIAHETDLVDVGGGGVVENSGELHKAGAGIVHFRGVAFNQNGILDFAGGTLWLSGGSQNSKTISVPAGGQLRIESDCVMAAGSTLTGPGNVSFENRVQSIQGAYTVSGITTISGGTVGFETDVTVQQLQLNSGTLQGAGMVHVSGNFNWTGGTMSGAGRTIIDNGATGVWTSAGDKVLQRALDNGGAMTWDQGNMFFRSGTLNNIGVMTIAHETDLVDVGGGGVFANSGTLHKVGNGIVHFRGIVFNQNGNVDFAGGTLWLSGGGQNTKTISVPAGGQLRIDSDYVQAAGSTLTGPGNVTFESRVQSIQGAYTVSGITTISGGTVGFESDVTVQQLQLSGGTFNGSGVVHVSGSFNWTGGTIGGAGRTTIDNGATGVWTSNGDKVLERALDNGGTITWDQGRILFRTGTLNNIGVMTIAHETDLADAGGGGVFANSGTLHKVGPGIVHCTGIVFNQNGVLDFAGGTLWLSGGGQNTKTIAVPAGGKLRIDGDYVMAMGSTVTGPGDVSFENRTQSIQGAYTVSGITTISAGIVAFETEATVPQLQLSGGTLQGAGVLHLSGSFNWSDGAMSGAGRTIIENGATAMWTGGGDKNLGRAMDNRGAITWDQGRMIFRSGTLNNIGVMTIAHDAGLVDGGGGGIFENTGTFNKSSGGTLFFSGVLFQQKGVLNGVGTIRPNPGQFEQHGTISPGLNIGALTWDGDLPQSADGSVRIEIGGDSNYDQLNVTGNAVLHGTVKVELAGGFVPVDGATFTVMQFASHTGAFDSIAGLNVSSDLFLEPTFTTTNLVLTVHGKPRPIFSNSRVEKAIGAPVFSISNIAGQTFILEARESFDAGTAWQDILTNPDSSVIYDFIDTDRANHPTRFFRVRLAP